MKKKKRNKGFTLVELMVVMAVVGILAGLTLTAFFGARKTARDGQRKADLEQIRSALEMYRTDEGSYPTTPASLSGYIELPSDPVAGRSYYYNKSGDTYELCAALEIPGGDSCGGSCGVTCNHKVRNP